MVRKAPKKLSKSSVRKKGKPPAIKESHPPVRLLTAEGWKRLMKH